MNQKLTLPKRLTRRFSRGIPNQKIEVVVSHGPHSNARDFEGFDTQVGETDIYIPELVGWDKKLAKKMNRISSGKADPVEVQDSRQLFDEFVSAEAQSLHGSGTDVAYVDLPSGRQQRKFEEELRGSSLSPIATSVFRHPSEPGALPFEEAIALTRQRIISRAETQKKREDHMIDHVAPAIQRTIAKNPDLKKKDVVTVQLRLGSMHTRVSQEMKRRSFAVRREFKTKPHVYDYPQEAVRASLFGKQLDDTLVARSLFSVALSNVLSTYDYGGNTLGRNAMIRTVASEYSYSDIQNFVENYQQNGYGMQLFVEEVFRTKGIHIPTGEAELNSFLGLEAA